MEFDCICKIQLWVSNIAQDILFDEQKVKKTVDNTKLLFYYIYTNLSKYRIGNFTT